MIVLYHLDGKIPSQPTNSNSNIIYDIITAMLQEGNKLQCNFVMRNNFRFYHLPLLQGFNTVFNYLEIP